MKRLSFKLIILELKILELKILKLTFGLVVFGIFLLNCVYGSVDILKHSVYIDGSEGLVISKFTVNVDQEKQVYFSSLAKIQEIVINGQKTKFFEVNKGKGIVYSAELSDSTGKTTIETKVKYDVVKEINKKGIVILSEVVRTLPNLETLDQQYPDSDITLTNFPAGIELFDGSNLKDSFGEIRRKYGAPVCLGYLNLFNFSKDNTRFKIVVPKGSEDVGLSIISWLGVINSFFDYMSLEFQGDINVIYYEDAIISENILNNVIISGFYKASNGDYFRNIDNLQNFVTEVHELLHVFLPRDIRSDVIDIVEGLIQFLAIESLEYVFDDPLPKELVYDSYFMTLNYLSKGDNNDDVMVKYRKYPLVFRYISSLTGMVQINSLFKFLSKQSSINMSVFEKGFYDITGLNFRAFRDLFDGMSVLWDLSLIFSQGEAKLSSTSPVDLTVHLDVYLQNSNYTMSVNIPKNSGILINLPSDVKSLVLNRGRIFPEYTMVNNYYNFSQDPEIMRILSVVEDVINFGRSSSLKYKNTLSKKVTKSLGKLISIKEQIFKDEYTKVFLENLYRINGDIVVYFSLNTIFSSAQGIVVIGYGKNYYIKDIVILN